MIHVTKRTHDQQVGMFSLRSTNLPSNICGYTFTCFILKDWKRVKDFFYDPLRKKNFSGVAGLIVMVFSWASTGQNKWSEYVIHGGESWTLTHRCNQIMLHYLTIQHGWQTCGPRNMLLCYLAFFKGVRRPCLALRHIFFRWTTKECTFLHLKALTVNSYD